MKFWFFSNEILFFFVEILILRKFIFFSKILILCLYEINVCHRLINQNVRHTYSNSTMPKSSLSSYDFMKKSSPNSSYRSPKSRNKISFKKSKFYSKKFKFRLKKLKCHKKSTKLLKNQNFVKYSKILKFRKNQNFVKSKKSKFRSKKLKFQ